MVKKSNGSIICVHNHRHHHEERNRQPFHDHMKSLPWEVVCLSHISHIIESFAFCQVYVHDLSNQICGSWEVYQQIVAETSGYQGRVMIVYFFYQYRLCPVRRADSSLEISCTSFNRRSKRCFTIVSGT